MSTVVLKLFAGQGTGHTDGQTDNFQSQVDGLSPHLDKLVYYYTLHNRKEAFCCNAIIPYIWNT